VGLSVARVARTVETSTLASQQAMTIAVGCLAELGELAVAGTFRCLPVAQEAPMTFD